MKTFWHEPESHRLTDRDPGASVGGDDEPGAVGDRDPDERLAPERLDVLDPSLERTDLPAFVVPRPTCLGPDAEDDLGGQRRGPGAEAERAGRRGRASSRVAIIGTSDIDGLPMNDATNVLAGREYTVSGSPTCSSRPWLITAIRSPIVIAST